MIDFDFVVRNFVCCVRIQSVVVIIDLTSKILLTIYTQNNENFREMETVFV